MNWLPVLRMTVLTQALLTAFPQFAAAALPLQSNHAQLQVVPAPGEVAVDGRLDEWDLSAEMYVYGVRKLRDRYSARVHAMWDTQAFYLAIRWRDPTPMMNNVDPDRAPGEGWMADSFQARFVTDHSQIHLTAWYSSKRNKCITQINYGHATNEQGMHVFRGDGASLADASGYRMALAKDSDQRGYVQEFRIPWSLLFSKPASAAGLKFRFTGEYFWGGPAATKWPAVMWSDPINPQQPQRIVVYQNPGCWGEAELLAKGNLPKPPSEEFEQLLQGPIAIRVDVPKDAVKFSLAIDDASGRRVRNLASHANVADYTIRTTGAIRTLEIPWDGRADGTWDKERMLFLGDVLPPGTYTVRVLHHTGIGVLHAGSFYNPGTPPWPTPEGTGSWGADHSIMLAVGSLPATAPPAKPGAKQGRVFLGNHGGECGVGFIGLNAEGRKIWEWIRLGTGAHFVSASEKHVYFVYQDSGRKALGRVHPDTGEELPFAGGTANVKLDGNPTGLAVNGAGTRAAVAFGPQNKVQILDASNGELLRELSVPSPDSLHFLPDGRLAGVSGVQLFTADPQAGEPQRFALTGVAEPLSLTIDAAGQVCIGDGRDSNVKVFDRMAADAKLARTIGEAGGHRPGPWNAKRMAPPASLAIEARPHGARLWVTERNHRPRRVSVWQVADGALVRDYLGNTGYAGTGGLLSDDLTDLGIIDGVTYKIDLPRYQYTPLEVMEGRPDLPPVANAPGTKTAVFHIGANHKGAVFCNGCHFVSTASGQPHEYYVEAGASACMVFMRRAGRWHCVAALGPPQHAPGLPSNPPGPHSVFSWSDLNGDGYQTVDEIQWRLMERPNVLSGGWGYRCGKDLVFYHSGLAFRPVRFSAEGAPVYDVTKADPLPGELAQVRGEIYKTQFGYLTNESRPNYKEPHGVIHGLHELCGYDAEGRKRWTYPNYWVSVHGAFSAPMAMPGVLMGVLKLSGIVPCGKHDIIVVRGNIGQDFLLRDDGLYVGELFTDQRMAPSSLPDDPNIIGAPINDTSLGGECFNGMIARQRDGKVRTTYGLVDVRVAEVTGLDGLAALPLQTLTLSPEDVVRAKTFVPNAGGGQHERTCKIERGGAWPLEAKPFEASDFGGIVVRAGREEVAKALMRYDDQHLHVLCHVADNTPWVNKGTSAPLAFKTGDSMNLFLAPGDAVAGGTRLLLTALKGRPVAMAYRPNGPAGEGFVFESPVRKSPFAHVGEAADASFQVKVEGQYYLIAASIPWKTLGIDPKSGLKLRGDLGVLFGDDAGGSTAQRVYWADRETNVVNDVPTEAEFSPLRWGTWLLR